VNYLEVMTMDHLTHPCRWTAISYDSIKKQADVFGIDFKRALAMRHGYLDAAAAELRAEIDELVTFLEQTPCAVMFRYELKALGKKLVELGKLNKRAMLKKTSGDLINDDMIAQAKDYPVEQLVEFARGKAKAWCHPDKNPSMYHANRTNRVNCPVCDKSFGPIDVCIERDGMTFVDAVRYLCG